MRTFQRFVTCLLLTFAALPATAATAPSAKKPARLDLCLRQASQGIDPVRRDEARASCLRHLGRDLTIRSCLKIARGFEYSTNSEDMKSFCLFESDADPSVTECKRAARSMEYGANRDTLIWGCLQRLNLVITKVDCDQLAQLMVFPSQKNRASSYCLHEIKAAVE